MCFTIDKKAPKYKGNVAYKVLHFSHLGRLDSPYKNFTWEPKKKYEVDALASTTSLAGNNASAGFYVFRTKKEALAYADSNWCSFVIAECRVTGYLFTSVRGFDRLLGVRAHTFRTCTVKYLSSYKPWGSCPATDVQKAFLKKLRKPAKKKVSK
jgi:hypothetical protein